MRPSKYPGACIPSVLQPDKAAIKESREHSAWEGFLLRVHLSTRIVSCLAGTSLGLGGGHDTLPSELTMLRKSGWSCASSKWITIITTAVKPRSRNKNATPRIIRARRQSQPGKVTMSPCIRPLTHMHVVLTSRVPGVRSCASAMPTFFFHDLHCICRGLCPHVGCAAQACPVPSLCADN